MAVRLESSMQMGENGTLVSIKVRHLCISGSCNGVHELLEVVRLPVWRGVRAVQHGGKMLQSRVKVPGVPALLAQNIMDVLFNKRPLMALVHRQNLPAEYTQPQGVS